MSKNPSGRYGRLGILFGLGALILWPNLHGCGGGIPIRLRIDEFNVAISIDDSISGLEQSLIGGGLLPATTQSLPELWPEDLSDIRYSTRILTPPTPVDLTPEDGGSEAGKKYAQINQLQEVLKRIELNRMVLRLEKNTSTVDLPSLELQIADDMNADPNDASAWRTLGILPSGPAQTVTDLEFEFFPGGESFLNSQLADEEKEFAIRAVGDLVYDTSLNPRRPSGEIQARLIVVVTFVLDPPIF